MIEVAGSEHEVCGEGEVVYPVGVGLESVKEFAGGAVPDFDGFVLRGGVDVACAAPFHA